MARAITRDPREYRRGMVLGLTLAETLLLLLFLLLMAAAAMLWRADEFARTQQDEQRVAISRSVEAERRTRVAEQALTDLQPVLEALQRQGLSAQSLTELAERLGRARTIEAERDRLRDAMAQLQAEVARTDAARRAADQQLALLRGNQTDAQRQTAQLQDMLARIAPLDPGRSPQAIVDGLAEVLKRQPEAGQAGSVAALQARVDALAATSAAAAAAIEGAQARDRQVAASQEEVERLRRLLAGRGGAGELYPSCWTSGGRPEFAFEVTLRNGGEVVVRDIAGANRMVGEPWTRLNSFPRGVPIPVETFVGAAKAISEWSTQQRPECRFFVQVRRDLRPGTPFEEYNRVLGPLGNPSTRHLPFYRVGG
jgi:hypothetical protein